jgi:hypothetical protein
MIVEKALAHIVRYADLHIVVQSRCVIRTYHNSRIQTTIDTCFEMCSLIHLVVSYIQTLTIEKEIL